MDILSDAILEYMRDIRQQPLTDKQSNRFQALMSATLNMESLADIVNNELVVVSKGFIELGAEPSDATRLLVSNLADKVVHAVDQVIQAVRENDEAAAEEVITLKEEVNQIVAQFLERQSERIAINDEGRLNLVRLEIEFLDNLRSIYILARRIAKDFVPDEVASQV